MDTPRLTMLGAADTVTGSRYLLEAEGRKLLVDCGLFQGYKTLRRRNWKPFPVPPATLHDVFLTHAHLDHCGYVPRLVADGFSRQIHCTAATRDLAEIILKDSAFLNERDAERSNRYGYTRHAPARPLYSVAEATESLSLFHPVSFDEIHRSGPIEYQFKHAGHILGAASLKLWYGNRSIVFSGDIGRCNDVTLADPEVFDEADCLVIESTYGNRFHGKAEGLDLLADVISRTVTRGGSVIIPSFAVGRTQQLLYLLSRLERAGRLPRIPVFLDSPMAINASDIYCAHPSDHSLGQAGCRAAFGIAQYVHGSEESKMITASKFPKVVIAGSGMATGGRVLHHLKTCLPDPRCAVILSGFQAGGTRGAKLAAGAESLKIHGHHFDVNAEIVQLDQLSAHADRAGLLEWIARFRRVPQTIFVTHGEPDAADALRLAIIERFGVRAIVSEHLESHAL
ncbi:MBL fold metallo-hydrolase RNA specificity domain-containing protein [Roseivivax sp. CAU 1761]